MATIVRKRNRVLKTLLLLFVFVSQGSLEAYYPRTYNPMCSPICNPICNLVPSDGEIFFSGDFLYWNVYQGGLNQCHKVFATETTSADKVSSEFRAKQSDLDAQWTPGFRVGAGYRFPSSKWAIAVYWTQFSFNSHGHSAPQQKLRWHLDFDVLDILVKYPFSPNCSFTITPFAGVRGAEIDQSLKLGRIDPCQCTLSGMHNKQDFFGVGPLMGIEAKLNLGAGFDLYGEAVASVLFGNFDVKFKNFDRFDGGSNFSYLKQNLNACQSVVDAAFGISWSDSFCDGLRLTLKLGLEHHCYFDYNRIGSYGNLCFDGGTFSASLSY